MSIGDQDQLEHSPSRTTELGSVSEKSSKLSFVLPRNVLAGASCGRVNVVMMIGAAKQRAKRVCDHA